MRTARSARGTGVFFALLLIGVGSVAYAGAASTVEPTATDAGVASTGSLECEEALATVRAELAAHDSLVRGALAQHDAEIKELLEALRIQQKFALEVQIEEALRSHMLLPVLFLPEVHGGNLGYVRQLVVDEIEHAAIPGINSPAYDTVLMGDTFRDATDYKTAFHFYAQAFCRISSDPNKACALRP